MWTYPHNTARFKRTIVLMVIVMSASIWLAGVGTGGAQEIRSDEELAAAARRELNSEDLQGLLSLTEVLIDPDASKSEREAAIKKLGQVYKHKLAIPALLAVIRDRNEEYYTRSKSVRALSYIADRRVIDLLIDILSFDDRQIASLAQRQLRKITGQNMNYDHGGDVTTRTSQAKIWRQWWDDNRDTAKLHWTLAYLSG